MNKKKVLILISVVLIFFAIFYIKNIPSEKYHQEFKFAVVQTSSVKLKSYISFFDENLNQISSMKINCGGLSQCWDFPKINDGKVFMNVKGTDLWIKSQIAEFNLANGKYRLHNVHQKFNTCFAVDGKNIYAANCTTNTNIIKYEIDSHKIKKLVIPNMYITHMKIYDNKLFSFGNFSVTKPNAFIYMINPDTMQIIKSIDITQCGLGQYDSVKICDDIFFTNYSQLKNEEWLSEIDSNILGKYNLKTGETEKIILNAPCPKQILRFENKLIISHEDWHQNGKYLSIYNLNTREKKLIEIENSPYQIYLYKNKIYSIDRKKIYRYDANTFKLEKQTDLDTQNNFGKDFFISGFFFND